MEPVCQGNEKEDKMIIEMILITEYWWDRDIPEESAIKEFELNWAHQVPHWRYLTDEGISFFKDLPPRKWKKTERFK